MSDFERGIKLVRGTVGKWVGKCDQCDAPIRAKDPSIEATFNVGVAILNVPVSKVLCLQCADDLANALKKRLREAGWK